MSGERERVRGGQSIDETSALERAWERINEYQQQQHMEVLLGNKEKEDFNETQYTFRRCTEKIMEFSRIFVQFRAAQGRLDHKVGNHLKPPSKLHCPVS